MNAPLSHFLIEFVGAPSAVEALIDMDLDVVEPVPAVTLPIEDYEQRLVEAREEGAAAARSAVEAELTASFAAERSDLIRDAEAEREALTERHGRALAERLTAAMAQLETTMADALASALRPMFEQATQARILSELAGTLDALLADPGHPVVRIEGPVELLTAFGDAHGSDLAVDYVVTDQAELTIIADGTRIATRLADCLARFPVSEG